MIAYTTFVLFLTISEYQALIKKLSEGILEQKGCYYNKWNFLGHHILQQVKLKSKATFTNDISGSSSQGWLFPFS